MFRGHPFDRTCRCHESSSGSPSPAIPWTNGPVERTNRTIKEATVGRYHYDNYKQIRQHLDDFIQAYNFA